MSPTRTQPALSSMSTHPLMQRCYDVCLDAGQDATRATLLLHQPELQPRACVEKEALLP